MESSGPLPNNLPQKLSQLFENLEEIQEAIAARVGPSHARFVSCVFSMGNAHAAYQTMVGHLSEDANSKASLEYMDEIWTRMMSNMIYLFAEATMKQSALWYGFSDAEKVDKIRVYINQIRDDVMLLTNKQQRG